ncbi:MAG: class I SAM-dependent methyltransferase [Dehalococcoidia bacterium]
MTDPQTKINALWNAASKEYDGQARHGVLDAREKAAWLAALRGLLPPAPADVVDVGTGTGMLALLISEMGHAVTGVDLAEEMLAQARAKAEAAGLAVRFELGDAHEPPGAAGRVDVVISRHVFWTLTDPPRALSNWRRLLRPGGRVVIIDGLWGASGTDDNRLGDIATSLPMMLADSLDQVRAVVEGAGFTGVAVSDLAEVERIELELHGPPEDAEPRYVMVARKPA